MLSRPAANRRSIPSETTADPLARRRPEASADGAGRDRQDLGDLLGGQEKPSHQSSKTLARRISSFNRSRSRGSADGSAAPPLLASGSRSTPSERAGSPHEPPIRSTYPVTEPLQDERREHVQVGRSRLIRRHRGDEAGERRERIRQLILYPEVAG